MPSKPNGQRTTRSDLTDRDCTRILGGLLGALIPMTSAEEVRDAVRWWANLTDPQWDEVLSRHRGSVSSGERFAEGLGWDT